MPPTNTQPTLISNGLHKATPLRGKPYTFKWPELNESKATALKHSTTKPVCHTKGVKEGNQYLEPRPIFVYVFSHGNTPS